MVKPKYVFFLSILWMSAFILNIKESSWKFLKEAMTDLYVKESLQFLHGDWSEGCVGRTRAM